LHTFATKFFYARSKREIWAAIGSIDRKLSWLKIMFDQRRKLYMRKGQVLTY
jgi:hypothetical protein